MDDNRGVREMRERQRKRIENTVGGLLGFAVAVGLMGLGMTALNAIGIDPITPGPITRGDV